MALDLTGAISDQSTLESDLDSEGAALSAAFGARLNSITSGNAAALNQLGTPVVPITPAIPAGASTGVTAGPLTTPLSIPPSAVQAAQTTPALIDSIPGVSTAAGVLAGGLKTVSWFSQLSLSGVVSIILGLILIGAGILFLRPPGTDTVIEAGKRAIQTTAA